MSHFISHLLWTSKSQVWGKNHKTSVKPKLSYSHPPATLSDTSFHFPLKLIHCFTVEGVVHSEVPFCKPRLYRRSLFSFWDQSCWNALSCCCVIGWFAICNNKQMNIVLNKMSSECVYPNKYFFHFTSLDHCTFLETLDIKLKYLIFIHTSFGVVVVFPAWGSL